MNNIFPCHCGGEFHIVGGEYLNAFVNMAMYAVCYDCQTILPYAYSGREESFKSKKEAVLCINRYKWKKKKEIYYE